MDCYDFLEKVQQEKHEREIKEIKDEEVKKMTEHLKEFHPNFSNFEIRKVIKKVWDRFPIKDVANNFIVMIHDTFNTPNYKEYIYYADLIDIGVVNHIKGAKGKKVVDVEIYATTENDEMIDKYFEEKVDKYYEENLKKITIDNYGKNMEEQIQLLWKDKKNREIWDFLFDNRNTYSNAWWAIWTTFTFENIEKSYKSFFKGE